MFVFRVDTISFTIRNSIHDSRRARNKAVLVPSSNFSKLEEQEFLGSTSNTMTTVYKQPRTLQQCWTVKPPLPSSCSKCCAFHFLPLVPNAAHSILSKIEPPHQKTDNLHMQKQRRRSACEADQRLCFRYTDSTIPLLSKSKLFSL